MYKPKAISGFPEWLPEQRYVELQWIDIIRKTFESFGFSSIETSAVEELDVLLAKGETDKEIYKINRLQGEEGKNERLGLHYDLTVPLARYVSQNMGELVFPFKRYQIQKVWRGEHAQEGRFREFYQCDIDVVNIDSLPISVDSEMVVVAFNALKKLGLSNFQFRVSNKKILEGFLNGLNITDTIPVFRLIDKIEKIGVKQFRENLKELNLSEFQIDKCVNFSNIKTHDSNFRELIESLGINNGLINEGLMELEEFQKNINQLPSEAVLYDFSIARGFDYYTGIVYESILLDERKLGSICSGGRYENLCSEFTNRKVPGVGIAIGLSRLISRHFRLNSSKINKKSPSDILVINPNEDMYKNTLETAAILRGRGFNVEVFYKPSKLQNQLSYANKKGIQYAWFPPFHEGGAHEVKNLLTGQQSFEDPETWNI